MSADDGHIIKERKDGKFELYHYQGEHQGKPRIFDTLREAVEASQEEWTEYGTTFDLITPQSKEGE